MLKKFRLILLIFIVISACSRKNSGNKFIGKILNDIKPLLKINLSPFKDLLDRQKCNLLNGCKPALLLEKQGENMVPFLCAYFFATEKIKNQYSRWRVVESVGKIKGERSCNCLIKILKYGYWQGVIPALFGIGDIGCTNALPEVEKVYEKYKNGQNIGILAATFYVYAKLKNRKYEEKIVEILKNKKISIFQWVYLRHVILAIEKLNLKKYAKLVAAYFGHPDYYVKREILFTLNKFNDPEVAPMIVSGLKSKYPFIKKYTLKLLQKFTKRYDLKRYEDWVNFFKGGER